jgi:glycosyltransferase involved in cell wall biosynthesis
MLADTLAILSAVRVPDRIEWECIVVNNNCTDRTNDVLASFAGRLPLRSINEPIAGISRSRNRAVREARGDVILFTDDDIHVDREWMAAYVDAMAAWPMASYFGGTIEPLYRSQPPAFVTDNLEALAGLLGMLDFGPMQRPFHGEERPFGGNMGVRRAIFDEWTFDEQLGHRHLNRNPGEETAFFADLQKRGRQGVWVPAAKVAHVIPPAQMTDAAIYRHFSAYGRWLVRRGDQQQTWMLRFPHWLCRAFCRVTRIRIALLRSAGMTSWASLLARCAVWEGMLEEARADPALTQKRMAEQKRLAEVVDE